MSTVEESEDQPLPIYPVLNELFPPDRTGDREIENLICGCLSTESASRLLEHFYSSPNKEFHTRIIRRRSLLDLENPRPTSRALLLSILCLACSMPNATQSTILPSISNEELASILEKLFFDLVMQFQDITRSDRRPALDDTITAYMLTSLAPTQKSPLVNLAQWIASLKYMVRKLNIIIGDDDPIMSLEEREERRRLWWATYVLDKHVALSFNQRCHIDDLEFHKFPLPCPDTYWESMAPLSDLLIGEAGEPKFWSYSVDSPDLFGLLLPLCRLLGEILDYHYIRQHSTLNAGKEFLGTIRANIGANLDLFYESVGTCSDSVDASISCPSMQSWELASDDKIILYSLHIYHCLHILLNGHIDLVSMYNDTAWQFSPEFVKAGEHAMACAQVANKILDIDPHLDLMHRFFGTYLLQSSFIFLILARKLRQRSDDLVYENCRINLKVLDAFTRVTNRAYQTAFANALRKTLSDITPGGSVSIEQEFVPNEMQVTLEPELLKYRWVAGYNGLWASKIALEP